MAMGYIDIHDNTSVFADSFDEEFSLSRFLEEVGNSTNSTTNGNSTSADESESDSAILRNTFTTYGSALLVVLLLLANLAACDPGRGRLTNAPEISKWFVR